MRRILSWDETLSKIPNWSRETWKNVTMLIVMSLLNLGLKYPYNKLLILMRYWNSRNQSRRLLPIRNTDGLISIIIPAYNESGNIRIALDVIEKQIKDKSRAEIIVVDGGSKDNTVECIKESIKNSSMKISLYHATGGRAFALNEGFKNSKGEILHFVHADTLLPLHFDEYVREALSNSKNIAGAFKFAINREKLNKPLDFIDVLEDITRWRSTNSQFPYGDQTIFIPRPIFETLGQFPPLPIMEDYEFIQKLRFFGALGGQDIITLDQCALCDGRRFEKNGIVKNTLLNQCFVFAYDVFKLNPNEIMKMYYK